MFGVAAHSHAQSADALFDQHYSAGHQFSNEQRFLEAVKEFEAAYKIRHEPTLALNIGRLYLRLKKQDLAVKYCADYLNDVDNPPANLKQKAQDCVEQARLLGSGTKKAVAKVPGKTAPPGSSNVTASASNGTQVPPTGVVAVDKAGTQASSPAASIGPGVSATAVRPDGTGTIGTTIAMHPVGPTEPRLGLEPSASSVSANNPIPTEEPEPEPAVRNPPLSQPPLVAATPAPKTDPLRAESTTPIHKKWWLWTIVGVGVAGAAAGITAGVLTSRASTSNTTTPESDPLEQIPPGSRITVTF